MVRYLLDTNALIAKTRQDPLLLQKLVEADEVFTSVIVVGELHFGAHRSSRVQENLKVLNDTLANITIIDCDTITARLYGEILAALLRKGRPNMPNDIWIAATAIQHGLSLLTEDKHFSFIDGLTLSAWQPTTE